MRDSIAARFSGDAHPDGFGHLRLLLAVGILAFHSVTVSYGSADAIPPFVMAAARLILPAFFSLSGFLVAASLERSSSLPEFAVLRLIRLMPGLGAVVLISALVLGPALGELPWHDYFRGPAWCAYFFNLVGIPVYDLPGLFTHSPRGGIVNGSLWTIRIELLCYLTLGAAGAMGMLRRRFLFVALFAGLIAAAVLGGRGTIGWFPLGLGFAFMAGTLLFLFAEHVPHHGLIGVILLTVSLVLTAFPGGVLFLGLPLSYVAIWMGTRRVLRFPLPGDYSYGLYLIGYPLEQSYVQLFPKGAWWQTLSVCLPTGLVLAALLWHLLEHPILRSKHRIIARLRAAPGLLAAPQHACGNGTGLS